MEEALRHCEGEGLLLSNRDEVSEGVKDPLPVGGSDALLVYEPEGVKVVHSVGVGDIDEVVELEGERVWVGDGDWRKVEETEGE